MFYLFVKIHYKIFANYLTIQSSNDIIHLTQRYFVLRYLGVLYSNAVLNCAVYFSKRGLILMKKFFAAILVSAMAVSLAACNNASSENSGSNSASANNSANNNEAKTSVSVYQNIEADPKTAEKVSEYIDSDKLGSKTATMFRVLESKNIKISVSSKVDLSSLMGAGNLTSGSKESSLTSEEEETAKTPIKFTFARSGDDNVLVSFGMNNSGMSFGLSVIANKDGSFLVNDSAKQYAKVDDENSGSSLAESSAVSEDKTSQAEESDSKIGSALSDLGLSTDSLDIKKPSITYSGETNEEFDGKTYSCETYVISVDNDSSSSDEKTDEVTFKVFFDGEVPKGISASADDQKFEISIDTFTVDVSESDFAINSEYKEVDSNELFSALLGIANPGLNISDLTETSATA